ncbi:DUF2634 domain-containing protein [Butyribacter intestini]|uniref:DUF2634 domain-containing protein n=1 Tax=Butyribacter intestini TaxID=1703332 RepID=UPI003AEF83FF
MFPFNLEDEEIDAEELEEETEKQEYEVDFETGKLTGRMISGIEAVKQWLTIALAIDRYKYTQFSWENGSELSTLIGQGYEKDYVDSEVERMIREVAELNEDITDVSDFNITFEGDRLTISFNVSTVYGEEDMTVNV